MDANTPATQPFPSGNPTQDGPRKDSPPKGNPIREDISRPARPKGPHASAVVLGLLALVLAGAIIANEAMNLSIDWTSFGPGAIVGVGALLVVLGAVGLVRRHDDT